MKISECHDRDCPTRRKCGRFQDKGEFGMSFYDRSTKTACFGFVGLGAFNRRRVDRAQTYEARA